MLVIPKDPMMLLSYINTQLRDNFSSLDILCAEGEIEKQWLEDTLGSIDYYYDAELNRFA